MTTRGKRTGEVPDASSTDQSRENLDQMLRDIEGLRQLQTFQARLLDELRRTVQIVAQES